LLQNPSILKDANAKLGFFPLKIILIFGISFLLTEPVPGQVRPDSVQTDTTSRPDISLPADSTLDSLGIMGSSPFDSLNTDSLGNGLPGDSAVVKSPQEKYVDSLRATSNLKATVTYNAADSIVFDVDKGVLFLYEEAELKYEEINLKAKRVRVDVNQQTLYANGVTDSLGNEEGRPEFTQDGETYNSKALSYNFKSEKGRVVDGRVIEGEGYILADVAKYHPDGSFHGKDGKYTTCDHPEPHFYIRSRKLKRLPNNQLISGPLNLVIAGFPIPIVVPFGFIPDTKEGQKNGVIFPTYGEAQDRGFFLRNLGYYWGINDNFDLRLEGDIYTRGGWRLQASTSYNLRYKFSGRFSFQYGVQRFNERTDPDFSRVSAWTVTWSHNQPIDPTARISASVNISSSNRFQREISYNQTDFFTNNLNSSVNFSKNFNNLPFSINLSARHQQDLNKETMSMQLPELTFNMQRQTPFKNIGGKNFRWLQQLGFNYNMQARNSLDRLPDSIVADVLLRPRDSVDWLLVERGDSILTRRVGSSFYSNGMRHNASTGTTIKLLNNINLTPSFTFAEFWYLETVRREWDSEAQRVVSNNVREFARGMNFSTALSASTNFYGIYQFTKSKRQVALRQRFTPSVSYSLKPDFADPQWGYFEEVQIDTTGRTQFFSIFEEGIYGGPTRGENQSLGFSLSSVLEMKYRSKESYEEDFDEKKDKFTRINILDNLSASTSYNFAADSFQLAPVSLRARTSLFNNKVSVNGSFNLDPYVFGTEPDQQRRLNKLMISETGQPGRITRAQISLSTSFQSKRKGSKKERSEDFDEAEFREIQNNLYQYVDFDIPWTLRFRYNLSYNNSRPGVVDPRVTQTVNFDGDVNFSTNWKIGYSSGFDIQKFEFTNTRISVFRNLHCWDLSFAWVPFGPQKSYSVNIAVRSATLKDLKLSKNNFWQDRFRGL
jgi:hypothetical protein